MNLSRRGFFKGVAALFAGAVAAQLPSCTTGPAPLAVAKEPIVEVVKERRVARWLHPGSINKYKGDILAHAVPTELLTATRIVEKQKVAQTSIDRIQREFVTQRWLPYSTVPLIEGITPTPDALLELGPPVS